VAARRGTAVQTPDSNEGINELDEGSTTPVRAATIRTRGHVPRVLAGIGIYMLVAGMVQSLVAIRGNDLRLGGFALGIAVAFGSAAIGAITDLPFGLYADVRGCPGLVEAGFVGAAGGCVALLMPGTAMFFLGAVLFGVSSSAIGNSLLAWLTFAAPSEDQPRVQGLNGSLQRVGTLLAAGLVGAALAVQWPGLLALAGLVASAVALSMLRRPGRELRRPLMPARRAGPLRSALQKVPPALRLFRSHGIRMAAASSLGINTVLLATNAYLPLVKGSHRALIVASSLASRDIVAIAVASFVTLRGLQVARGGYLAASLFLQAASLALCGKLLGSFWVIALSGVAGSGVGIGIPICNLFTIKASSPAERTVGMAVGILPTRLLVFGLPLSVSPLLTAFGLARVFEVFGLVLAVVACYVVVDIRHERVLATS